jgi:hypothetical protein
MMLRRRRVGWLLQRLDALARCEYDVDRQEQVLKNAVRAFV